jgi:hypothetical protein
MYGTHPDPTIVALPRADFSRVCPVPMPLWLPAHPAYRM